MENNKRKVTVKSAVDHIVGLVVPELRFSRIFTKEGETKQIDFEILYEAVTEPGAKALFERGLLYISNEQDRIDLGLQEPEEDPVLILTKGQIIKLLKVDTLEDFEKTFRKLPKGQAMRVAETAVAEKITDYAKCQVIKEVLNFDVLLNVQNAED